VLAMLEAASASLAGGGEFVPVREVPAPVELSALPRIEVPA
jgi:hypothetical protein